jgi:hypothetical protein
LLVFLAIGGAPNASADLTFCLPAGPGAGECDMPSAVTVDLGSGEVFVADERRNVEHENDRVDVFSASGGFLRAFGWDVIPSGQPGDTGPGLEVCTAATQCKAASKGSGAGQFERPTAIAVDNSCFLHSPQLDETTTPKCSEFDLADGDVYVFDSRNARVERFHPDGSFVLAFGAPGTGPGQFSSDAHVAVGADGRVYVADKNHVQRFDRDGNLLDNFTAITSDGNNSGIATDPSGDFYVASSNILTGVIGGVRKYSSAGTLLYLIDPFPTTNTTAAIAVDETGDLFVADNSPAQGGAPTAIYEYDSTGGPIHVFYGNGTLLGAQVALAPYSDSSGDIFTVDSSTPRFVAHIAEEPAGPVVLPFETKASAVGNVRATLNARINPEGPATEAQLEYVSDAAYQHDLGEGGDGFGEAFLSEPPVSLGSNFASATDVGAKSLSFAIACPEPEVGLEAKLESGECLEAETLYHFRAVASNEDGDVVGEEEDFETLPPIQLGPVWATGVGADTARLHAELNPTGIRASAHFEYVDDAAYTADSEGGGDGFGGAALTPEIDFGAGIAPVSHSSLLFPLEPGTTYHYRYTAHDFFGDFTVPQRTFVTPGGPLSPPPCPNEVFRDGPGASLPDCRAYELVSPLEKEGGDIVAPFELSETSFGAAPGRIDQATPEGGAIAYSSYRGFGDVGSVPLSSQYVARRDPGTGWSSVSVTPPREGLSMFFVGGGAPTETLFRAFSEDLCSDWFAQDTELALAPGAPPNVPNLYRHGNCGGAAGGYELLSTVQPPGWGEEDQQTVAFYRPSLGGFSEDGSVAAFGAPAPLTPEAMTVPLGTQLPCQTATPAIETTYKWLRNGVPITGATEPQYTPSPLSATTPATTVGDAGAAIQCQATSPKTGAGSVGISNPPSVVAPFPGTAPPVAPVTMPAPTANAPLTVGGGGAQILTCNPQSKKWGGSPVGFTYRWFRNGAQIPGQTEPTYTVTAINVASPATFQCVVTGENGGGKASAASAVLPTSPPPAPAAAPDPSVFDIYRVYLHDGSGLHLVSVLPNGNVATTRSAVGTAQEIADKRLYDSVHNAVSADGSRVFWSADVDALAPPAHKGRSGARLSRLYLRLNPAAEQSAVNGSEECTEAGKACTIAISSGAAVFHGANPAGTKALYAEGEELFEVDTDAAGRYEAGARTLIAGKVKGLIGASEDLSRVYLVSAEDRDGAGPAAAGRFNLYLFEAGGFTFVAKLLGDAWQPDPNNSKRPISGDLRSISPFPINHSSRVSQDGLHATFMSDSLELAEATAGYDNTDAVSGEADSEVYLFSASESKLVCVSCNPGGGRPEGKPLYTTPGGVGELWAAARIPGWETQWHASRLLSADGSKLFFESFEGLVSRDTNGKRDVYEWERAANRGECESMGAERFVAGSEGCLSLISSGKSAGESEFIDASESGSDVFFSTPSSLVTQDYGLIDIYDAREGGGFPPPPQPKSPCEGEACQSPPAAPANPTPASSAFEGEGNVKGQPKPRKHCPKGKRKMRVAGKARCVPKHREHKHRRHRRHHRRAHR